MVICHRLNMNYLKRKCPVGVDQNRHLDYVTPDEYEKTRSQPN